MQDTLVGDCGRASGWFLGDQGRRQGGSGLGEQEEASSTPWVQALELTLHSRPAAHARPLAGISPHMDLQTGSHQGWEGWPGGMCTESQQAHSHYCRRGVSSIACPHPSTFSLSRHNGASGPLLGPSSVLISSSDQKEGEGALL